MSAADTVNGYLNAFYAGDFAAARPFLDEAFHFTGPFIEAKDRETYLASAAPLGRVVRGHRLLRQWLDGSEIASVYEVRLETAVGAGVVSMFEWHKVAQHLLVSSRLLFDTQSFRALMPRAAG